MATTSLVIESAVTHTITLASLASSATAGRAGTAINHTTAVSGVIAPEVMLFGKITTGTTPTNGGLIEVWVYSSGDGTLYSGGASGTDAALTPTSTSLMVLSHSIAVSSTSNVTHVLPLINVTALLGGPPLYWGVWVRNGSGVALNATAGNHAIQHRTITYASV